MFFYTIQADQENRMINFFWRNEKSRVDYDYFGDVVVFVTTYHTNKYNLTCVPFVGVFGHFWVVHLFLSVFGGCLLGVAIFDTTRELNTKLAG